MKKLILICILIAAPVFAVPTIEFSPGPSSGSWYYNGAGTLTFNQVIDVDRGLGNNADSLVGAWVHIPTMTVGTVPGGYTLTPVNSTITIQNAAGTVTYLSGTLGSGDLAPIGTEAGAYTVFQVDMSNITVNNTIGSAALASIGSKMDFELSFQGAPSQGFKWMIDNNKKGSDGFSGAMTAISTVPAPGAVLLGSIGICVVGWLRRRRAL